MVRARQVPGNRAADYGELMSQSLRHTTEDDIFLILTAYG